MKRKDFQFLLFSSGKREREIVIVIEIERG